MKQLRVVHADGENVFLDNPQIDVMENGALLVFEDRARTQLIAAFGVGMWGAFYVEDQV